MNYPHDHDNDVIYFGKTNFRNAMRKFGIKTDDRRRHMYVIGKTGMGKTTLLENMILSDIYAGHGCCFVDPHGDTADTLLDYIPSWRINDVVYFNPSDVDNPIGFNILESIDPTMKYLVASSLMSVFKKIWENVWSARMEYILNNTILALLDTPGSTLLGINRMLSDKDFRTEIIKNVQDPIVKSFWIKEFATYDAKFAAEAVAPIQNKVGQFLSSSIMRNIVAQAKSSINIRKIMDDQKIFIVNLSKGRIGEDAMRLLGGMLITKIQVSAMERVNMPEKERNDFYLYVDEFQNFAVESFAGILSEARKYRLNLIMAHQYIAQLSEEVRDAVFGNVGTIIAFRVGSPDAVFMESEFMPRFTPEDLINLPKTGIYIKLMIDGVTSTPFSSFTLPPIAQNTGSRERVVQQSRERYAGNRAQIEERVAVWSGFGENVDVEEELAKVAAVKKDEKKKRFAHEYACTRCAKTFSLPVELDRSRPIYCEECNVLIKAEREKGKEKRDQRQTGKEAPRPAPAVREGALVTKPAESSASLANLAPPAAAPVPPVPLVPPAPKPPAAPPAPSLAPAPAPVAPKPAPAAAAPQPKAADMLQEKVQPQPQPSAPAPTPAIAAAPESEEQKRKRKRRRRNRSEGAPAPAPVPQTSPTPAAAPPAPKAAAPTPAPASPPPAPKPLAPGERVMFDEL